jgi:hypothetical protein
VSRWRRAPLVYVAGPYRAPADFQRQQNIQRAHALALEVWKVGGAAICPHANTANFDRELPDEAFLDGDLAILDRCDAVVLTPDWNLSRGACAEVCHANDLGLPVFETIAELAGWIAYHATAVAS